MSDLQVKTAKDIAWYLFRKGYPGGTHLTVQTLAKHFGVSRTPVRSALEILSENGLVEYRRNRGFFLRRKLNAEDPAQVGALDNGHDIVKTKIVTDWQEGNLGDIFSEAEIRRRYGLGRLTASRTLLELAEEGVISRRRGHGWCFEPAISSETAYEDSYNFRMMIEPGAILCPTFALDQDLAEGSRAAHTSILSGEIVEQQKSRLFELDAQFHWLIAFSSRNRFFLSVIERQNVLRRIVEYAAPFDSEKLRQSCQQHLQILDVIEEGNLDLAANYMRLHLDTARIGGPRYHLSTDAGGGRHR